MLLYVSFHSILFRLSSSFFFCFILLDFDFELIFYFISMRLNLSAKHFTFGKNIYFDFRFVFYTPHHHRPILDYSLVCVLAFCVCNFVDVRVAFGILHCQLEWLLHNSSIHQLESMLRWYIHDAHAVWHLEWTSKMGKCGGIEDAERRLKIETNLASNMIFYFITAVA